MKIDPKSKIFSSGINWKTKRSRNIAVVTVLIVLITSHYACTCFDRQGSISNNVRPEAIAEVRAKAEQGSAKEQEIPGYWYNEGIGVKKDYTESVKWYRKAAEQGDAYAELELGEIYDTGGFGLKQDYQEAYFWRGLSVLNAPKNKKFDYASIWSEDRDESARHLTPEQKAGVDKRVQDWAKAHPTPPLKPCASTPPTLDSKDPLAQWREKTPCKEHVP